MLGKPTTNQSSKHGKFYYLEIKTVIYITTYNVKSCYHVTLENIYGSCRKPLSDTAHNACMWIKESESPMDVTPETYLKQ